MYPKPTPNSLSIMPLRLDDREQRRRPKKKKKRGFARVKRGKGVPKMRRMRDITLPGELKVSRRRRELSAPPLPSGGSLSAALSALADVFLGVD